MTDEQTTPLSGLRILVVEDEFYLADDLSRALVAAGATIVGPYGSMAEAEDAIDRGDFDCAVLDVNLRGELSFAIAEQLEAGNVPFVVATGYNQAFLPDALTDAPRIEKPFAPREVIDLLGETCRKTRVGTSPS